MYIQNFVGIVQAKPPVFTHVLGHGFVAKRKRLLAKICKRVVWQLYNGLFSNRERFKYVCYRTINKANKMESIHIFEKKEKWKNNLLTILWALLFASELEVDH